MKNDGYQSDKDDLYATIEEEALATYTTAVAQCDVYEETGISGDVAAYVNSVDGMIPITSARPRPRITSVLRGSW